MSEDIRLYTPSADKKIIAGREVSSSSVYYGVNLTAIAPNVQTPLVCMDKAEVLKQLKKYPGARFKAFPSKEEACHFSKSSHEAAGLHSGEVSQPDEKASSCRAPKSQEIVKLRKAIEKGDVEFFSSTIWSNPRYLVTGGDTPTIMQEGFHYTALHVAAKFNQPVICKMILNAIHDLKFLQILYEDDLPSVQGRRIEYLTDLYLNLPDKGLSETPLHFACKFGCIKVVEILLLYPACDRNHRNKYRQTAQQIICDRLTTTNARLKKEIEKLFEERYFVPVLRSEDNSVAPVLGKPFSPESVNSLPQTDVTSSPTQSQLRVRAIAGPMSPQLAEQFYKKWKGPSSPISRSNCKLEHNSVRLGDSGKGLERIGRILAKEHQVVWNEHWPFLDDWCNFSTTSGMKKLEQHFQDVHNKIIQDNLKKVVGVMEKATCNNINEPITPENKKWLSSPSPHSHKDSSVEFSPVTKLCKELENFHISSRQKIQPWLDSDEDCYKRKSVTCEEDAYPKLKDVVRTLTFDTPPPSRTNGKIEMENKKNCQEEKGRLEMLSDLDAPLSMKYYKEDMYEESDELFFTPPNSPTCFESPLYTPEELQPFYILGSSPSKVDFDVLRALEDVAIDPHTCPLVYLWKEIMSKKSYDKFSSAFTPQRSISGDNCSPQSVPLTHCGESLRTRQDCWTFPVKKKTL